MENFRPNVGVSGAYPWDEDNWENILFCRPGTDIHGKCRDCPSYRAGE